MTNNAQRFVLCCLVNQEIAYVFRRSSLESWKSSRK